MPTFQTPNPITVAAEVLSASVTVIASDRTDTVVEVRPADPVKKGDVRAAAHTTVDLSGDTLTVRAPKDWRTYTPFGGNPTIEVTIEVPTGSRLSATAAVGHILTTGELGDCDLDISAGDIVLDHIRGSVTAKAAQGDIRIGVASHGVLRLETAMGELEVGVHPSSTVRLETTAPVGTVRNLMDPVGNSRNTDEVQVYARNLYGNIIVRHANAA
ncbi:DUF4097 family beta strand repeat protein [Nocardia otitidiscaviarum]|uniref:DUF4097 family beta strand repeat-containing protein n=1 Tax=Nocardia otitidiscaviarum TaxID=1823 RepID=UPI0004A7162C|nr:DUF4097 family beta strand repeat-containing protein [Nocardia otitidiscaviarum]MBF6133937.1 DUF4097 family beta strand repeat protein [Nocardia otitidiscaviarum]MBF6484402.1 DUF4097 family beta strand repeat protein [Nocardia otitidiscaviarum]